jgi:hypothetical protein
VEVLPGLAPAFLDVTGDPRAEYLPEALLAPGAGVGGEFDPSVDFDLFEPFWKEVDQDGARLLAPLGSDTDRNAADERVVQRNAARSFSKNPSSGL